MLCQSLRHITYPKKLQGLLSMLCFENKFPRDGIHPHLNQNFVISSKFIFYYNLSLISYFTILYIFSYSWPYFICYLIFHHTLYLIIYFTILYILSYILSYFIPHLIFHPTLYHTSYLILYFTLIYVLSYILSYFISYLI